MAGRGLSSCLASGAYCGSRRTNAWGPHAPGHPAQGRGQSGRAPVLPAKTVRVVREPPLLDCLLAGALLCHPWPTPGIAGAAITTWVCTRGRGSSSKSRSFRDPFRSSGAWIRSEEHTSELQSWLHLVCRLLLEKKNKGVLSRSSENLSQPK